MKISYKNVGASSYTMLGDEADRSLLLEEFRPSFTPANQVEPLFRAANTFKAARGNLGVSLQLVVSIPYATRAAALVGLATLKAALAVKSHLKLEQDGTTHYYPNAVLTDFTPQFIGVTVRHSLTFTTDDVTTSAP